jgi:hypothetical protein
MVISGCCQFLVVQPNQVQISQCSAFALPAGARFHVTEHLHFAGPHVRTFPFALSAAEPLQAFVPSRPDIVLGRKLAI